MKHIMQLTRRHDFPHCEGTIYPSDTGHTNHIKKGFVMRVLSAWFDMMVPNDTTELVVYMSGFDLYRRHLRYACKKRNISLTEMWIKSGLKKADKGVTMNPNAYIAKVIH